MVGKTMNVTKMGNIKQQTTNNGVCNSSIKFEWVTKIENEYNEISFYYWP